jgi:hypothetical protein
MKKLFLYITVVAFTAVGCNNDLATEGISRITYFPEFVMEGGDLYFIEEGEPFTDPGVIALEGGEEIPFTTTYIGRYSGYTGTTIGAAADEYRLTYSAVNKDGFTATENRNIFAVNTGDFVSSIEGTYTATSVRVSGEAYEDVFMMVREVSPNVFEISCSLGGFYSDGRALGDGYLVLGGRITLTDLPNGAFTYTPQVERADGIVLNMSEMEIDTDAKTISFRITTGEFANGDWTITLTQLQP